MERRMISWPAYPSIHERTSYRQSGVRDYFMVHLLCGAIEEFLSRYAREVKIPGNLLDVGCGGQPLRPFAESLGFSYKGLDLQQNSQQTVDFVCSIDQELPENILERGPFNMILLTEVLEHIPQWGPAFKNLGRLSACEGHILITCPHFFYLHEEPYDFWRPTLYALSYYADLYGFDVVEATKLGGAWEILGTLLSSTAMRKKENSFGGSVLTRILYGLLTLLRRGILQKHLDLESPFYFSNFIVLKKRNL